MRDASITLRRASGTALRACVAVLLLAAACALGGCASGSATSGSFAMAGGGDSPTIAFESIDGPPPPVFDRMVSVLDSETKLRSLQVVSRETPAAYRVRSYLAAQVVRGKTVIAWVWDVYDRDQQRALRLSGEEAAGKAGRDAMRDPWAAADDLVLRKIDRIQEFWAGKPAPMGCQRRHRPDISSLVELSRFRGKTRYAECRIQQDTGRSLDVGQERLHQACRR